MIFFSTSILAHIPHLLLILLFSISVALIMRAHTSWSSFKEIVGLRPLLLSVPTFFLLRRSAC